jgi:hypothetical protein
LFQKGVIQNNSLALKRKGVRGKEGERRLWDLEEAIEVSIGVGRSSGPIDHVNLGERKGNSLGKFFNGFVDWTILQLCVFVEEWSDERGIEKHHHNAHDEEKDPNIEIKVWPTQTDDPDHASKDRGADDKAQGDGHQFVLNVKSHSLGKVYLPNKIKPNRFIESMPLLDDKGRIEREWKGEKCVHDAGQNDENNGC